MKRTNLTEEKSTKESDGDLDEVDKGTNDSKVDIEEKSN